MIAHTLELFTRRIHVKEIAVLGVNATPYDNKEQAGKKIIGICVELANLFWKKEHETKIKTEPH